MNLPKTSVLAAASLALFVYHNGISSLHAQSSKELPTPVFASSASLDLSPEKTSYLKTAIANHDYVAAETMLLEQIKQAPHSLHSSVLLAYVGSVYFLNRDYLNAAIAWKKADAIAPLEPRLKFSLAMAYIQIAHPDWARTLLETLMTQGEKNGNNSLYTYWLGRLDYDARRYPEAIHHFQEAIALDPTSARAFDNLGLCYFYENKNELALETFDKAIKLDQASSHPSPWPHLNLAETLEFLNRTKEAEAELREAINLDSQLAVAHYRLGQLLENQSHLAQATPELLEAIRLNNKYAEAHIALAQVYSRLNQKDAAAEQVQIYRRLRADSGSDRQ